MNPIQVRRIINNLLENAWRYGGQPVELQTYRDGDQVVLAVLDRGPGIPEDQIARLMQPFTRLDPSRSGSTGAGLGLAIVNRLALSHHAMFSLGEREGGGLVAKVSFLAIS
jgi:signal transduction histidine kinase